VYILCVSIIFEYRQKRGSDRGLWIELIYFWVSIIVQQGTKGRRQREPKYE
jgi:hypothetical protein